VRARATALVLVAVLVFYLLLAAERGVWLIETGKPLLVLFGIGVLMLPVVGAWFAVKEVRLGSASSRLGKRLEAEGLWPTEEIPRRPSGRVDLAAADEIFEKRKAEVEAAPEDWRGWYRLSLAYYAARDTARAREALRQAIALDASDPSRSAAQSGH
jgi:tetratricopeptide (TPR) repeat protein